MGWVGRKRKRRGLGGKEEEEERGVEEEDGRGGKEEEEAGAGWEGRGRGNIATIVIALHFPELLCLPSSYCDGMVCVKTATQ